MMLDLALHFVDAGYRIFPLATDSKLPAIPRERGGKGCLDATRDRVLIERWWTDYPNANVGIATGKGLLVIDVDPRKTDEWLHSMHTLGLPETYTIRTASGGWHLYFTMPSVPHISIGANLLPGIDWRGNGGYVVAAGSTVKGALYRVVRPGVLASAPVSLLQRLAQHRALARPVASPAGHTVIPDGQRNETLFALACLQRRFGLEFNAIYEALRAANADHCEPPLEDDELRQIAASAVRRYAPSQSRGSPHATSGSDA